MIYLKRALLSVSDKRGLKELACGLRDLGVELWASGGTARHLREGGVEVRALEALTGFTELLGGRVKTLHPHVHAALLARRDDPRQLEELRAQGVEPFDLAVVNLYPFERRVSQGTPPEEAMEWVDIGGEALIRAAAKNFRYVGVVVDPEDYPHLLRELREHGGLREEFSRELAAKAFVHVTRYNAQIARWFSSAVPGPPPILAWASPRRLVLRYGENPHQQGALYGSRPPAQLQGKTLSYVNLLDADAAWGCAQEFERPTAVIVKHATPCGVASGATLAEALERALQADEKSAFGGIIGVNVPLDEETARQIVQRFFEVVIAPDVTDEAREVLLRRTNLRVLKAPSADGSSEEGAQWEVRTTAFGLLAQTPSRRPLTERDLETVTRRTPAEAELRDLLFAWRVVKWAKSNAIVLAKDEQTVGIGAGQVSRVDAVALAVRKAREGQGVEGSVLASDAFFPFRDSVDLAAQAGVRAIAQPGGSVRDEEVIQAANEHGLAMVFTRVREFRH